METTLLEMTGTVVAAILTLLVFSYLLGDNVLYRLTEHLFVGVAVGYALVVVFHTVLASKLLVPFAEAIGEGDGMRLLLLSLSLILGLLLLTKPFKAVSWLGSISVAFLLGAGAALAIGGALLGTLLPQVEATADVTGYTAQYGAGVGLLSAILVLVGTIGVLLHFYFSRRQGGPLAGLRDTLVKGWGGVGRWFMLVAFASLLATGFISRLSLLVGRIEFLLESVRGLLGG